MLGGRRVPGFSQEGPQVLSAFPEGGAGDSRRPPSPASGAIDRTAHPSGIRGPRACARRGPGGVPGRRARQAARARPAVLPGASMGTAGAAQGVWSRPRGPRRVQAGPPSHQRSSEALPEPDPILCQLVPTAGAPRPGHWWPHQVYRPPLDTGWRGPAQTARELSPSGLRGAPARRRPPRALPPRPLAIGLLGTAGPSEPPGRGPSGLMVHVAQCALAWQPPGPLEAAAAGPHRRFLSCAGIPLPRPSARPRFPTRPSELASGSPRVPVSGGPTICPPPS